MWSSWSKAGWMGNCYNYFGRCFGGLLKRETHTYHLVLSTAYPMSYGSWQTLWEGALIGRHEAKDRGPHMNTVLKFIKA